MKRNTYVTAALFVVFGLLTVAYWQMDRAPVEDQIPMTSTLSELEIPTAGDIAESEGAETEVDSEDADIEGEEEVETIADAKTEDEDEDESSRDVISTIDALRTEMEHGHAAQVSSLTEIIASADFDADTKSAARDALNQLQVLASNSRMLETVIEHMGFNDVLVRADAEFVQVTVQVSSLEDAPTREELAELYVLAGIEFGNHRNGNISIDFQPLN
jgi:hypothetical protein